MEWLTLERYFLMSWHSGCLKQASLNLNVRCLSIISMHHMIQKLLFNLMLMTVYIGLLLKLLETFVWMLQEIDSMWTSWGVHIGSCQSEFIIWRTITIHYIRLDMLLLLWLSIWILPQSTQVRSFIRLYFHLIGYSPRMLHLPMMIKLRIWLDNSVLTIDIVLYRWFIFIYKSRFEFWSTQVGKVFIKSW